VIGTRRFLYGLWGESVNTASRKSVDPGTREQLIDVLATPMRIVLADPIV